MSYHNTANDAKKLMKITLGSINSAFIRRAGFDVKLAAEMMNQLVAQSANGGTEIPNSSVSTVNNDPKRLVVNRYSDGDRLFDHGGLPATTDANSVSDEKLAGRKKRILNSDNKVFYMYMYGKGADVKQYVLAETDSVFMTQLLTGTPDKKAVYMNNAIMPGTTFTMELLGISGITYLSQFTLDHVPDTYSYENAVWQVSDIKHRIENKSWTTTITAQVRPLTTV
jgi:hypothetical protein